MGLGDRRKPELDVAIIDHELGLGTRRPVPGNRHIARRADDGGAGVALAADLLGSGIGQLDVEALGSVEHRKGAPACRGVEARAAGNRYQDG